MLACSVLILLNAKTESSHPPISLDDFGGFSLLNKNFLVKTQNFSGKNFAVCKKVRNFVSEINCKFNRI